MFIDFNYIDTTGLYSLPPDISDVFESGKSAGANIHSASWGTSSETGYSVINKYFDGYSHSDDDFLAIVAAGNHGYSSSKKQFDVPNTVFEPASAKNVLSGTYIVQLLKLFILSDMRETKYLNP